MTTVIATVHQGLEVLFNIQVGILVQPRGLKMRAPRAPLKRLTDYKHVTTSVKHIFAASPEIQNLRIKIAVVTFQQDVVRTNHARDSSSHLPTLNQLFRQQRC